MSTGRVTAYRGAFGFIRDALGTDFYFHRDDLIDGFDVKVGDAVSFQPEIPAPAKGPRARRITFIAGPQS